MNKVGNEIWNEKAGQVLHVALKLLKPEAETVPGAIPSEAELDLILCKLSAIQEEIKFKTILIDERTARLNNLIDVLLQYTIMDFSPKADLSEVGDEIDAIALGVNTLGEELESHIHLLTEKTQSLERSNKQLEQFVYIASHDLNEPLRTLSNYVNLFSSDYRDKLDQTALKHLQRIMNATVRMEALIHDLLEYARVGQTKDIIEINSRLLVQEVLSDLAVSILESDAKIDVHELPVVYGNYAAVKSVFQNLISNAIKFRKKDVHPIITISSSANNIEWAFAISDNGIGIEQQYQERIFSIFQKLHSHKEYAGTGIGLAQCKKSVEEFGGRIWIESEVGKGSIFYFTILKLNK
jgi:light-regulated signal transduction histidine kinase (bacteriophytochrome)